MLKIGEFSRLSQIPVSTLRYYDDIGLIKPMAVDGFTGYRYYSAEQLPTLNHIGVLKDLGLPLAEIVRLAENGTNQAELRSALERRRAESVNAIEMEKSRLQRIETWMENLAKETTMDTYEVSIKKVNPQLAVCLRRVMPAYTSEGELWGELCAYLGTLKDVRFAGPAMTIYHDMEYREKDVDMELAMPLAVRIPDHGNIKMRTLPGHEQVASVLHKGPFDTINTAYQFMLGWVEKGGYRVDGPDRVLYLTDPEEVSPADVLQELQVPISRP